MLDRNVPFSVAHSNRWAARMTNQLQNQDVCFLVVLSGCVTRCVIIITSAVFPVGCVKCLQRASLVYWFVIPLTAGTIISRIWQMSSCVEQIRTKWSWLKTGIGSHVTWRAKCLRVCLPTTNPNRWFLYSAFLFHGIADGFNTKFRHGLRHCTAETNNVWPSLRWPYKCATLKKTSIFNWDEQ